MPCGDNISRYERSQPGHRDWEWIPWQINMFGAYSDRQEASCSMFCWRRVNVVFVNHRDVACLYMHTLYWLVSCVYLTPFSIPFFSTYSLLPRPYLSYARSCPTVVVKALFACWSSSHGALARPIDLSERSLDLADCVGL